ncbi:ATP-binding protein [Acinetobacter baumannii]
MSHETKTFANEELMFIAFRNLFDNAIRYSPALGAIHVEPSQYQQKLKISIEDTGNGVDDEVLRRLGTKAFFSCIRDKATRLRVRSYQFHIKIIQLRGGELHFMHASQGGLKVEVILPLTVKYKKQHGYPCYPFFVFPTNIIETRGSFLFS